MKDFLTCFLQVEKSFLLIQLEWSTMNNRTNQLLKFLSEGYAGILKANLVGIYLYGSYVLGSYNEQISDLDYLVVVRQKLKDFEKIELMDYTLEKLLLLAPNKGRNFIYWN